MAGRKPLPTHLKLVKGTARPHRLNKGEPKPTVAVPEPPAHLDERARAKFAAMAEMLARHGVMTELDAGALARYAVVWGRWVDAEAEIKRRGPVVKTEGGNVIQNPFLAVANKCLLQMAQIESEFGLTPSSRSRIRMTRTVNNLAVLATSSWFRPLSADASKMDGLNIHFAAVDEVHEHPGPEIVQKLNTATGARRQPLIFEITTAGHDRHSVCWQHHEFSVKALEGSIPAEATESWFAYIATIDPGDDWTDPAVWIKANPSLGVTVKVEDLKRQVDEAREMPAQQNAIRRLRLNEWTEQVTRWLDMGVWDEGGQPKGATPAAVKTDMDALAERLAGRQCFGGLDLARVNDLSAFVLLFPPHGAGDLGDKWSTLCRFWVPEEDILRRARRDRVPYDLWRDQGWLVATPGNTTDFAFIEQEILNLAGTYDLREIAFDRTFAGEIIQNLQDEGLALVEFGQGFLSMAAPTAELERLIVSRALWHGGHPVLRWNASNVAVRQDPAGNIKPDKERSTERIDGISALINALGRAMVRGEAERSVYEDRGFLVF